MPLGRARSKGQSPRSWPGHRWRPRGSSPRARPLLPGTQGSPAWRQESEESPQPSRAHGSGMWPSWDYTCHQWPISLPGRCDSLTLGSLCLLASLGRPRARTQQVTLSQCTPALARGHGSQVVLWGPRDQQASSLPVRTLSPSPQVARQSPTMFVLIMNNCHIEIDAHRLNDGGLLLSYNGNSYTTYMKEEVNRCVWGWWVVHGAGSPSRGLCVV